MKNLIEKINAHAREFECYYNNLIEFNSHTNLTAITEKNEVYVKHFLDSILPAEEIKHNASVVDVGTGAGFPGLPLKIVRPDINLTLVDSLNKRINFLADLCEKLELNATVLNENLTTKNSNSINLVHARAEDFCSTNREKFDVAVARAVAKLNTLVEYLLPLVKVGGVVLAYKGNNFEDELKQAKNAIKVLGGEYYKTLKFSLPENLAEKVLTPANTKKENEDKNINSTINNSIGERNIIVIKKVKPTPKEYPRPQNKPKTKPII